MVRKGEIEGRFAPHFYKPEFFELENRIKRLGIVFSKLKKLSRKIFSGMTPLSGGDAYSDKENGIVFLRSGDYSEQNDIDFDELIYLKKEIHQRDMRHSQLQKNDLLIAIVGATIGKVGVYKFDIEANINQAICAVRLKEEINPDFVHCFLLTSVGQKFLDRIKRPVARANINLDEIGRLEIPILSVEIQTKICAVFEDVYAEKRAKETEAAALLSSIDGYLLDALGICPPSQTERKRFFYTSAKQVSGGRCDPFYHQNEFEEFEKALKKGKYMIQSLKNLIFKIETGKGIYTFDEIGFDYLNVNNIKKWEVDLSKTEKIANIENYPNVVQYGDILTGRVGTIGNFALYHFEKQSLISDNVLKIRAKGNINTDYLNSVLNSAIIFKQLKKNSKGAVQEVINTQTIKSLLIPLPPLAVQTEIADHIAALRARARQLSREANEIVEQAKWQVEQMILGAA